MNRIIRSTPWGQVRQKGTTLIVALVLVLLATLLAVFAMNVGLFEQRASGNDVRSRLVQQTTEASLSQGVEYFRANIAQIDIDAVDAGGALWERCPATDLSFPCGTVEQFAADKVTPRRANMYRFIGGSSTADLNGDGSVDVLDKRMVPFDRLSTSGSLTTVGNGFTVNYGTGALLCVVQNPKTATDPTKCTTDMTQGAGTNILTLVAIGNMPGESGHTTLSMAVGPHNTLNNPPGKPPVVASGSANLLGTMQIVTNPNAAGPGVPVSIWTRQALTGGGTPNSCYLDEFIRFGAQQNKPPIYEGTKPPIITCDTCNCGAAYSLSSASGNSVVGGIDVLYGPPGPVGGPDTQSVGFTNFAIRKNEFPCDMFQFVFGQPAWQDNTSPVDYFCETALTQDYSANGVNVTAGRADEAYLYANATTIIPTSGNAAKLTANQKINGATPTCSTALTSASTGMIWDQQGCGIGSNAQVGTPDAPVLLIEDGSTSIQGRMFGLLFVRSKNSPLDPTTGGDGDLTMNAGAVVYGSVVVQGSVTRANGTSAIVYNSTVLSNLGKEQQFNPFAPVPASWTDRFSY